MPWLTVSVIVPNHGMFDMNYYSGRLNTVRYVYILLYGKLLTCSRATRWDCTPRMREQNCGYEILE